MIKKPEDPMFKEIGKPEEPDYSLAIFVFLVAVTMLGIGLLIGVSIP